MRQIADKCLTAKRQRNFSLISILFLMFLLLLSLAACDNGGVGWYESLDISTYRDFGVPSSVLPPARISSFPQNLDNVKTVNDYYFAANFPSWGSASWEIFLDLTYTEENFNLELQRLQSFDANNSKRALYLDENGVLFNFPTYIEMYDARKDYTQYYSFINIDETNFRMVYVYLYRPSRWNRSRHYREIAVPAEHRPKNYSSNKNLSTLDGNFFSIYASDSQLIWF